MIVKYKGKRPLRGSREAAGYDLYADEDVTIRGFELVKVRTGLSVEMPPGTFGKVYGRSGLAVKQSLVSFAGVVDSDYRSEIHVVLFNAGFQTQRINRGDRIAQLVFHRHEVADWVEVDELSPTDRGSGGFGSTGVR